MFRRGYFFEGLDHRRREDHSATHPSHIDRKSNFESSTKVIKIFEFDWQVDIYPLKFPFWVLVNYQQDGRLAPAYFFAQLQIIWPTFENG